MSLDDAVLKLRYYIFDHGKVWHYADKGSDEIQWKYNSALALIVDEIFQLYQKLFVIVFFVYYFFSSGFSSCLLFYAPFAVLDYLGIFFS